jgi:hypothetical protein
MIASIQRGVDIMTPQIGDSLSKKSPSEAWSISASSVAKRRWRQAIGCRRLLPSRSILGNDSVLYQDIGSTVSC